MNYDDYLKSFDCTLIEISPKKDKIGKSRTFITYSCNKCNEIFEKRLDMFEKRFNGCTCKTLRETKENPNTLLSSQYKNIIENFKDCIFIKLYSKKYSGRFRSVVQYKCNCGIKDIRIDNLKKFRGC